MLRDLEPVDPQVREPISSEITRRLLDFLISGGVHPGQRLPSERILAETLGVGRSHVRQAIKSLTMLGLIDVRQGDGTYFKRTDSPLLPLAIEWGLLLGSKQTQNLVEARSELEVLVAGLAAERRDVDTLGEMRRCLAIMETSTDPDELVEADVAFHLEVAKATGNQSLVQIMSSIRNLLTVWITRVVHTPGSRPITWREHAGVLEAIEQGDPIAARKAMTGHMEGAFARLRGTLDEQGLLATEGPGAQPDGPAAGADS